MFKNYVILGFCLLMIVGFIMLIYGTKPVQQQQELLLKMSPEEYEKKLLKEKRDRNILKWVGIAFIIVGGGTIIYIEYFLNTSKAQMLGDMYLQNSSCNNCDKYIKARRNALNPLKGNLELGLHYQKECDNCVGEILNDRIGKRTNNLGMYKMNRDYDYYKKGLNMVTGELGRIRQAELEKGNLEIFPKIPV